MRDCLLIVRALADVVAGGEVIATAGPAVPSGWSVLPQSGGWFSVTAPDGVTIEVWRANVNATGTRGLFACFHPDRLVLQRLDAGSDLSATLRAAWQAALAGNATARAVMRRWPVYRCSGTVRLYDADGNPAGTRAFVDERHRLLSDGATLPDPSTSPLPWHLDVGGATVTHGSAAEHIHVTSILRPAMDATIAGWEDHLDAENAA